MKHFIQRFAIIVVSLFVLGVTASKAQLIVTSADSISQCTPEWLVRNVLLDGNVSISNVKFNGSTDVIDCNSIGVFRTGPTPTNLGMEEGIVLATGGVSVCVGPNDNTEAAVADSCPNYYDETIHQLAGMDVFDVAVLEFDFVPMSTEVEFSYVFGSEEYPEYVGFGYNDVFGFFVDGINPDGGLYVSQNMALIPGTQLSVSIDNVNPDNHSEYYIDNEHGMTVQFDGFTVLLTVSFKVEPMTEYHIKMAICDVGDYFVDSGVFIKAHSFVSQMEYDMTIDGMHYQEIPYDHVFCTNRDIEFNTITSWIYDDVVWYFGDGASAQGANVTHAYAEDGEYEVINVLHNPHRAEDSLFLTKTIRVQTLSSSQEAFTCSDVPYSWLGQQLVESGVYIDTLVSQTTGCDSIVTLYLTVEEAILTELERSSCGEFEWNGHTFTESGVYVDTLVSPSTGCDSIVTLYLTVTETIYTAFERSSCGEFEWNGHTFTESGVYVDTLVSPITGCDSIVALHLTIHQVDTTYFDVTSCDSYVWNGQILTEGGVYEKVTQNIYGCDSVLILNLALEEAFNLEKSVKSCNSYTWRGQTYTTSGTYSAEAPGPYGCDSTFVLHLTLDYDVVVDTTARACEEFDWRGQTYYESGDYEYVSQTSRGCDSIIRLSLTIDQFRELALQGPSSVYAATNLFSGNFMYCVPDSLDIPYGGLVWSCSHPDWIITPSESSYRCRLSVTNIGQGVLTAQTAEGCGALFTINIGAGWFDVDENGMSAASVFPNPAQSEVTVQATAITHVRIIDAFGQVAYDSPFGGVDSIILNAGDLPQGVFVVEVTTKQGRMVRRLVIAK